MALFSEVAAEAARRFLAAGGYDPFVVEFHHRGKKDAPSGTAQALAAAVASAGEGRDVVVGLPSGPVAPGAVHVASVRAGHETGTHTVGFDGENDVVTLTHRTRGRAGLALGAVLAAEWVRTRRGVHGFDRVIADLVRGGGRT
jgi:4-hydroxy-tetrahydrodipicolinate reductase